MLTSSRRTAFTTPTIGAKKSRGLCRVAITNSRINAFIYRPPTIGGSTQEKYTVDDFCVVTDDNAVIAAQIQH